MPQLACSTISHAYSENYLLKPAYFISTQLQKGSSNFRKSYPAFKIKKDQIYFNKNVKIWRLLIIHLNHKT